MTNRIKYSRKAQAPSIPTPGQAYGYEESEDGTLKKQEAPNKDVSLGPAFYNVSQVRGVICCALVPRGRGHFFSRGCAAASTETERKNYDILIHFYDQLVIVVVLMNLCIL